MPQDLRPEICHHVQQSLLRIGCPYVVAEYGGDRAIRLSGVVRHANERSLATAMVRTVAGVNVVKCKIQLSSEI